MTTDKPEVKRCDCTSEDSYHCNSCFTMKEQPRGDYVEWENCEALQAKYEKPLKHLQNLIDQTTPLEPEPGNPMRSRRIQLDEVIAEHDQLRAELEQLRKDAERYRWITTHDEWTEYVEYAICEDGRKPVIDAAIDAAMETTK